MSNGVAIVGIGCIFPGAHSPAQLWFDILAQRRHFRTLPDCRLPRSLYYDADLSAPDKTYCQRMAVITDWSFDPLDFDLPPALVPQADPTHWLALWSAREALRDAQIELDEIDRERTSVIVGNTLGGELSRNIYLRQRWPHVERAFRSAMAESEESVNDMEGFLTNLRRQFLAGTPETTEDTLPGTMSNTIAGRICGYFDLGGGAYSVDGACSSSLLAVTQGCESIIRGESELVLAGAVDSSLDTYELVGFAKARALAREDIRPYDRNANGMLPGEGCAFLLLADENTARTKGWPIRAIIRGWGYSSDGRSSGLTRPQSNGQVRAMQRAYRRAGYAPESVRLFEGHGTGTTVGDEIELLSMLKLLADGPQGTLCSLGSIKGNIGHCKAAAGLAGLVKAVLALEQKVLPPMAGCEEPHHLFGRPYGPLAPALEAEQWSRASEPRRAGISAFGFGGSNAHITIEEFDDSSPAIPHRQTLRIRQALQKRAVFFIAGETQGDLRETLALIAQLAHEISEAELVDLAAESARSVGSGAHRLAIVARSPEHLHATSLTLLRKIDKGKATDALGGPSVYARQIQEGIEPRLAALFPGQGSPYPAMEDAIATRFPLVEELYKELDGELLEIRGRGLLRFSSSQLRGADERQRERRTRQLRATEEAQPAIVAASIAYAEVLRFVGLEPDLVIGHSVGELSALSVGGALKPGQACRLAALRGQLMANPQLDDPGGMLAISAAAERCAELLRESGADAVISAYNSPEQTVISGDTESIESMRSACEAVDIPCQRLNVSHGFHSPRMATVLEQFANVLEDTPFASPRLKIMSTTSGKLLTDSKEIRENLARQLTEPVRFLQAVTKAVRQAPTLWVEMGPGSALTGLTRNILNSIDSSGAQDSVIMTSALAGTSPLDQIDSIAAQAFVMGFPVDPRKLYAHRPHLPRRLDYKPEFLKNTCEYNAEERFDVSLPARVDPNESGETEQREEAIEFVRVWLAQKTGYPLDSISPESRLQDNIALDSIKSIELIQALGTKLGTELTPGPRWTNARISELVDFALGLSSDDSANDRTAPSLRGTRLLAPEQGGNWVRAFKATLAAAPLDAETPLLPPRRDIAIISLTALDSTATIIGQALEQSGFSVWQCRTLYCSDKALAETTLGGVIILLPAIPSEAAPWDRARLDLQCFEALVKSLQAIIPRFDMGAHPRVLCVRSDPTPDVARAMDGGAAMLRSLALEFPQLICKWLCLPARWAPKEAADIVVQELRGASDHIHYIYNAEEQRQTPVYSTFEYDAEGDGLALDEQDLILATGGAQGITNELVKELAERGARRFALLGRSEGTRPQPAKQLKKLREVGLEVEYYLCDVRDAVQTAQVVERIEARQGPVSVILHGAGVTKPSAFEALDPDSVKACLETKMMGIANLLSSIKPDRLRALHLISSVLGQSGMARQIDYAGANGWLSGFASELQEPFPGIHILALGYSLWSGVGIGTKLGTLDVLQGLGMTALQPKQGRDAYARLLDMQGNGPFIISGRLVPELEKQLFPAPPPSSGPFIEAWLRWIPGVEAIAETSLSLEDNPYLADHVYDGTPLLPAVLGIDAMATVAQCCLSSDHLPILRDLRFLSPVVVPHERSVRLRIYAVAAPDNGSVRTTIRIETDGFRNDCFSAVCDFGEASEKSPSPLTQPLPRFRPLSPAQEACLFQGPTFRHTTAIALIDEENWLTELSVPESENPLSAIETTTPYPFLRDAFLQGLLMTSDEPMLPTGAESIRIEKRATLGSKVMCRISIRDRRDAQLIADCDVFDLDGAHLESIRGLTLKHVSR